MISFRVQVVSFCVLVLLVLALCLVSYRFGFCFCFVVALFSFCLGLRSCRIWFIHLFPRLVYVEVSFRVRFVVCDVRLDFT